MSHASSQRCPPNRGKAISTNVAPDNFMQLVDMDAPNYPYRFYRSALFDAVLSGQIGGFSRSSDGSVRFRITGLQSRSDVIQASTNLVHWSNLGTNTAGEGIMHFTDSEAVNLPQRFYRLQSGP